MADKDAPEPRPETRDPAEIAKFSALAAQWWDPKGPFGALHRMNPVRLGFIRERVRTHFHAMSARSGKPLAGLTALDIGCGGGLVSVPLARMGAKVTGIDASEDAIGAARAHAEASGVSIDYRATTAEAMAGARFDLVTALEIIEHVSDVGAFLEAASALARPGGLIIVSTINRTAQARALAIFGAEKILKWAPEGAHQYEKLVTPEEIRALASEVDWDAPQGLSYNPIGAGWELSRDVSMNYLMAGVKRD